MKGLTFPRSLAFVVAALCTVVFAPCALSQPVAPAMTTDQAREELAYTIGVQAVIYGFPSLEMYRVRYRAVFDPDNKARAALNQFRHRRELIDHTMRLVVAPNNGTHS